MQRSLNNHFNRGNSGTRSLFCILCSGLFPLFCGCEKTFIDINISSPKLCILTSGMLMLLIQPNFAKHLNDIIWVPGYSKNHFVLFSPFFLPSSFWIPTKKKKKNLLCSAEFFSTSLLWTLSTIIFWARNLNFPAPSEDNTSKTMLEATNLVCYFSIKTPLPPQSKWINDVYPLNWKK